MLDDSTILLRALLLNEQKNFECKFMYLGLRRKDRRAAAHAAAATTHNNTDTVINSFFSGATPTQISLRNRSVTRIYDRDDPVRDLMQSKKLELYRDELNTDYTCLTSFFPSLTRFLETTF